MILGDDLAQRVADLVARWREGAPSAIAFASPDFGSGTSGAIYFKCGKGPEFGMESYQLAGPVHSPVIILISSCRADGESDRSGAKFSIIRIEFSFPSRSGLKNGSTSSLAADVSPTPPRAEGGVAEEMKILTPAEVLVSKLRPSQSQGGVRQRPRYSESRRQENYSKAARNSSKTSLQSLW